jgi:hypothetical protein
MPTPANQIFLPWVQSGAAANIPDAATDKLGANQPAVVTLAVKLSVNADTVEKNVRLYSPGEITGIDPQQVVRTEPRHRTTDFEPNYFPAVEFDRPDFPWLFTPARSNAQGQLRPWLCLVVVRKQEGVTLRPAGKGPLPVLEIKPPARPPDELPDLAESWAWAHAQITGSETGQLKETLANAPAKSVSRLLCPRRLDPQTEYLACVVPTFELGRRAGLDEPFTADDEKRLDPAWLSPQPAPLNVKAPLEVRLPVYFQWEFRTGAGGDFEELVRRLEAREMPPEVGKRPLDISRPGFKPETQPPTNMPRVVLGLEGALRVVGSKPDVWPDAARLPFQNQLKKILNAPWQVATKGDGGTPDPVVGPPVYGCWQAAKHEVAAPGPPPSPPWLDELYLDPRNRATAGMGTGVVQSQQEELMTSAWEQLGEIEKINQRLRQAQLSRAVNNVYHTKTFKRFSEETFLKVVAPAQSRLVLEERVAGLPTNAPSAKMLLAQKIAGSPVPVNTVSAPLRRITRPRGAINRQYARAGAEGVGSLVTFFNRADAAAAVNVPSAPGETVWVEDNTPAGAVLVGEGDAWNWITANPAPYSGTRCHQSNVGAATHQHFFHSATATLNIRSGDRLFAYVFLELNSVPSQIMLQWHSDSWEHRAYWGMSKIVWGVEGTSSRRRMGDLPPVGGWVRLEVTAEQVGLVGHTLDGMAFTLFGGRASWDRAGKFSPPDRGGVSINQVSDTFPAKAGYVWITDPPAHWERIKADQIKLSNAFRPGSFSAQAVSAKQPVPAELAPFREAARAHQDYLSKTFLNLLMLPLRTKMSTPEIKTSALVSLEPSKTVSARVLAGVRIKSPQPTANADPLEPLMDAPEFPQPMYEALRDLSQDFLLPGLELVPPDTVQLLETNAKFVESFLVGLNAEMSRELLWRGYPTDQRGTYFQHFWDTLDDDGPQTPPDIPPIHQWEQRKLGDNATGAAAGNKLVLLIRGELLRRYPNTVIYAVRAVLKGTQRTLAPDPAEEFHPVFRGTMQPDVTFLGFNLTAAQATSGAGFYFVLQQQPTEPRFGLDVASFPARPAGQPETPRELVKWSDLNWGDIAANEASLKLLSHVPVNRLRLKTKQSDKATWGKNSAHMAYITKQVPARIAIHASEMLPAQPTAGSQK